VREELQPIWNGIREELRRETPDFKFHIWLDPLELAAAQERVLYVRAPEHVRTWVTERYLPLLRRAAERSHHPNAVVEIVAGDWRPPEAGRVEEPARDDESRLNPKYTFEQFVIGGGNRFAHAAALKVAELPAQAYNPLFVHGPPGLGKTHLLHAIGNYVRRYGSGLEVRYATVEEFTRGFVESVRHNRTSDFKDRFRSPDVVLVDDVQFLSRGERTREEFFHTFNSLYESGRQLVMTSDKGPDALPELEERLTERFQCGLVVGLEPPSFEVRRAILEKRACLDDLTLPGETLDEIARSVTSSVRALEGALIRVVAYASLEDAAPTPALARHVLQRLGASGVDTIAGISEIVDAAARQFGVRREELLARGRRADVSEARQVAMYLARELTDHSLPEIGRGIGGRNHATVLHAINRISTAIGSNQRVKDVVDNLRHELGARP
jgi:chromosomal replication initiator protein